MRFVRTLVLGSIIGASALSVSPLASAAPPSVCSDRAEGGPTIAYGLTANQRLICFKVDRPTMQQTLMAAGNVSAPDTALVGIDVRPANGAIYGLGNAGGLYVLDPAGTRPELKARLNVALEGRSFGLDFNPTVDRLRVVSDSGQNLRINVDTGAVTVDGFLKSGTARAAGIGGVAYTNNDTDTSTATTLFDLDSVNDQLVTQVPPNDGVLVPVGRLGFRGSSVSAFDIWTSVKDGKAVDNMGFAALDGGGSLFSIDLKLGSATFIGNVGTELVGLTFPI